MSTNDTSTPFVSVCRGFGPKHDAFLRDSMSFLSFHGVPLSFFVARNPLIFVYSIFGRDEFIGYDGSIEDFKESDLDHFHSKFENILSSFTFSFSFFLISFVVFLVSLTFVVLGEFSLVSFYPFESVFYLVLYFCMVFFGIISFVGPVAYFLSRHVVRSFSSSRLQAFWTLMNSAYFLSDGTFCSIEYSPDRSELDPFIVKRLFSEDDVLRVLVKTYDEYVSVDFVLADGGMFVLEDICSDFSDYLSLRSSFSDRVEIVSFKSTF